MMTLEKLLKEQDFTQLKLIIEKEFGERPVETIVSNEGGYTHIFQFKIKDEFFADVTPTISYHFSQTSFDNVELDCRMFVDRIYDPTNDAYFYTKYKDSLQDVFYEANDVLNVWLLKKEKPFQPMDILGVKVEKFKEISRSEEDMMKLEDEYLAFMNSPKVTEFKNGVNKIVKKVEGENLLVTEAIEKMNWQREIDRALEEKDFELLKKMSQMSVTN